MVLGKARKGREQGGTGEIAEKKLVGAERVVKVQQIEGDRANTIAEGMELRSGVMGG
jgi:hypothetical protein